MEPVGLFVSLAPAFHAAVDCFEYVQLGKNFSVDYQTSRLTLDCAQLRLTRWGEAVGIYGDIEATTSLQDASVPQQNVKLAEELLGHIYNLFQRAEERSSRIQPGDREVSDDATDLSAAGRSLHRRILGICRRRQKKTSMARRAKWAIYERTHFNEVISEIDKSLDRLINLFPAVERTQREISEREAAELINEEALPQLQEVAASRDVLLEGALAKLRKSESKVASYMWNSGSTKIMNQVSGTQTINGGLNFSFGSP